MKILLIISILLIGCGKMPDSTEPLTDINNGQEEFDIIKYRVSVETFCKKFTSVYYNDINENWTFYNMEESNTYSGGSGVWEYIIELPIDQELITYLRADQPSTNCENVTIEIYFNDILIDSDITIEAYDNAILEIPVTNMR